MTRLITRRVRLGSSCRIAVLWLLTSLALAGCDGGIFGTGDGEDILDAPENPVTGAEPSPSPIDPIVPTDPAEPTEPPANPAPTEPATPVGGEPTLIPETADNAFSNTVAETDRPDALLRFVLTNPALEDSIVATNNEDIDDPLLPLPGLFFLNGIDNYRAVPAATDHNVEIFLSEAFRVGNADPIISLNPLEVSAGSATTLIVRGGNTPEGTSIGILVAETKVFPENSTSQLRTIHAASSYSDNGPIDIYLVESDNEIDDAVWETTALSYVESPISDYAEIPEGEYDIIVVPSDQTELQIPLDTQIVVSSEQVLTLVIRDDTTLSPGEGISIVVVEDSSLIEE